MNQEKLKNRTKLFSLRVLKLVKALPSSMEGQVMGRQLLRAANYRAACRGRSKSEFAAKIGIVEEEADECAFWMELIIEAQLLPADLLKELHAEAKELTAIMASPRMTAKQNLRSSIGNRQSKIGNS